MDTVDASVDQPWVSLKEHGFTASRNALAAALVSELVILLSTYEQDAFKCYRSSWESYNAFAGEQVRLSSASKVLQGEMLGVDDGGGLRLMVDGCEQTFIGGELSLRGLS